MFGSVYGMRPVGMRHNGASILHHPSLQGGMSHLGSFKLPPWGCSTVASSCAWGWFWCSSSSWERAHQAWNWSRKWCVGCQFACRRLTAPTVLSAVFWGVTDVCTQLYCVSDVSCMCAQQFKCIFMCHTKCFHVFHVSQACAHVCTVCQVRHKCVHMCPADLYSVPDVFRHFILCARCVSLILTVCPVCNRVTERRVNAYYMVMTNVSK